MYSEKDLVNAKKQLKKIVFILIGILLLFLAISITLAKLVNNRLGMLIMVLGVCIDIFIWGVYGAPIYSYYRFLNELITGRTRNIQGLVKDISESSVYKDNKLFYYEITIEEDGVDRVLLLDDQKAWPKIDTEGLYRFQIHENFVIDLAQIA